MKPNVGEQSLHQVTNVYREFLKNFIIANKLLIDGPIFLHKNIHKAMWRLPDGKTCNQIHHIYGNWTPKCLLKKSFYRRKEKPHRKLAVTELQNPEILSLYESKFRTNLQAGPTAGQENRGLRQNDALLRLLFNLALEKVIKLPSLTAKETIYQKTLQTLEFSDYITLVDRSRKFV
nr:uncharacterized protein LOC122268772 [Parasteatoda tepidariorum]